MSNWTIIKEDDPRTLPEPHLPGSGFSTSVLVTVVDEFATTRDGEMRRFVCETFYNHGLGKWIVMGGGHIKGTVLAWMPKPQPWQGG